MNKQDTEVSPKDIRSWQELHRFSKLGLIQSGLIATALAAFLMDLKSLPGKILMLVAKTWALDTGQALQKIQVRMAFKYRKLYAIGAHADFFQEDTAKLYEPARYGELKIESSGKSILLGLRDNKLERLGVWPW